MSSSDRHSDDPPSPPSTNSIPAPLPPPRVSSPLAPRHHRSTASPTHAPAVAAARGDQPSGTSSLRTLHLSSTRPPSRMSRVFNLADALDDTWDVDDVDRPEHLSEIFSFLPTMAARESNEEGSTRSRPGDSTMTLSSVARAGPSTPPRQSPTTLTFDQLLGAVPRPPRPLPVPASTSRTTSHLGPVPFRPSALGMSFPNNRIDGNGGSSTATAGASEPHPWTVPLETARLAGYTGNSGTRATDYDNLARRQPRTAETARSRWAEARDRERETQRQHARDIVAAYPAPPTPSRPMLPIVPRTRPSTGDETSNIGPSPQQLYGSRNSNERMATTMLRRRRTDTDRATDRTTMTARTVFGLDDMDIEPAGRGHNHIWDQLGDPDADSDDDDGTISIPWGLFREGEPVTSTLAAGDTDDSIGILPHALDDISLDGWGGNAERGATLSRGRFNRRRQSVRRSADESDDFAIDFSPRPRQYSYAPTNAGNAEEPVVVGGLPPAVRTTISTLGRRRRSGGAAAMDATKPSDRPDLPAMAKRRRKDLQDLAPARPTYLSFTALPASAVLPSEFVTPSGHSKLELSTRDVGDLPNRPVVTFAPRHKVDNGDDDACSITTTKPIPSGIGVHYYEIEVLSLGKCANLTVGWMTRGLKLNRLVGWDKGSWGWHGDDGKTFEGSGSGCDFSPAWCLGDVVGCGIDYTTGRAFFTRNGKLLGHAFSKIPQELYPAVGLRAATESLAVNFTGPFTYDIDSHVAAISTKVRDSAIKPPPTVFSSPTTPMGRVPRLAEVASEKQSVGEAPSDTATQLGGEATSGTGGQPPSSARLPLGSSLNDPANRAAAAMVFDFLKTSGHDRVLSLLASSMADRGMISSRVPTSPALPPTDEAVLASTKNDYPSLASAVRSASAAIARPSAIPWSLLTSLDPQIVPEREVRLAILDFAALAAQAGDKAAASAPADHDMDLDAAESDGMDTDMDDDLSDLDGQVLTVGQDLRRRSQAEHWLEADARLLEHAATLLVGPSALADEVIRAARAEEAEKMKQRLESALGLKSRSRLETAIGQMHLVTEALGAVGDGSAAFVGVDSVIKPAATQQNSG